MPIHYSTNTPMNHRTPTDYINSSRAPVVPVTSSLLLLNAKKIRSAALTQGQVQRIRSSTDKIVDLITKVFSRNPERHKL